MIDFKVIFHAQIDIFLKIKAGVHTYFTSSSMTGIPPLCYATNFLENGEHMVISFSTIFALSAPRR